MRGVPDVAGDADAQGGVPIVYAGGRTPFIASASGTEAAAPLWAGLIALADQYAQSTLASLIPPSTASPAAPVTTRRFTILLPVTAS